MKNKEVLDELEELNSPLAHFPREMPYSVPPDYFGRLTIDAAKWARASDVPAGYFQALPSAMLEAAKASDVSVSRKPSKNNTRVIAMPVRSWAAAAILLVSFSIGGALLFNSASSSPEDVLTAVPTEALQDYVTANLDISTGPGAFIAPPDLTILSDGELEAYVSDEGLLY